MTHGNWELFLWQPANVLSQLSLVPVLITHCNSTAEGETALLTLRSAKGTCYCWTYKLWLEMKKEKTTNGGSMSAGEQRDRMSCGMWCLWLVGQSEIMIYSHLPGFSGASVTFSWTSLGITKIKPNRPVNVRLLSTHIYYKHGRYFSPCSPLYDILFWYFIFDCELWL